jgi:hypothetical protein
MQTRAVITSSAAEVCPPDGRIELTSLTRNYLQLTGYRPKSRITWPHRFSKAQISSRQAVSGIVRSGIVTIGNQTWRMWRNCHTSGKPAGGSLLSEPDRPDFPDTNQDFRA